MQQFIPVEEAKALIRRHTVRLAPAPYALAEASGLVLAEGIIASINIPSYPQSSMDGYAVNVVSGQTRWKLTGEMQAGSGHAIHLQPGEAIRIFTGAAVPPGADTVLIQEKARVEDGFLYSEDTALSAGANVRPVGSEIRAGELALEAGSLLTPAAIGFLAGMGITHVLAYPLPAVSIIVTGNELQTPGHPLGYGQVYEANSFTLLACLGQLGITPIGLYRCADNPEQLTEILHNALEESDVVLMTGGVSVGAYDFTTAAFDACGVEKVFHKVRQKPGKPILFGKRGSRLVFGLPGNPASVLSCYYQYVLEAFSGLTGTTQRLRTVSAALAADFTKPAGLTHFLKAHYDGNCVRLLGGQESYKLNSFAIANGVAEIPADSTFLAAGTPVIVHLFR